MSGTERPGYHHGDLRTALLAAAEAELAETGVEHFSLRACARRAGVSHAAPKHHFGSAQGLLDALAASGFRRMAEAMEEAMADAAPTDRLVRSGVGYVLFARANPALFKLMFSRSRVTDPNPDLGTAGAAAFAILRENAAVAASGRSGEDLPLAIAASWSLVHGLAHLLIEDSPAIRALLGDGEIEPLVERVLTRPLPLAG